MGTGAVIWCGHWAQTPVGPFSELVLAVPARIGPRVGLSVVVNIVTSIDARVAGQLGWGFPRRLGTLQWLAVDNTRTLSWREGEVTIEGEAQGTTGRPYGTLFRALQHRVDGPVVVPIRVVGWSRRARLKVHAREEDEFAPVTGEVYGRLVGGRQVVLHPARRPLGVWRTFTAPLRAPDPGLSPG